MTRTRSRKKKHSQPAPRFPKGAVAKMQELRADGLSYREIGDHFGTDEHTAYNHTKDVKVPEPEAQEPEESEQNVHDSEASQPITNTIRINVPLSFSTADLLGLATKSLAQGYQNPLEYVQALEESVQQIREIKRRVEAQKLLQSQVVKQEPPDPYDLECKRLVKAIKTKYLQEMYDSLPSVRAERAAAERAAQEARQATRGRALAEKRANTLVDLVISCRQQNKSIEETLRYLQLLGVNQQELETLSLPTLFK